MLLSFFSSGYLSWTSHQGHSAVPPDTNNFSGCDDSCHTYHKRLDRYCHRSLLRSHHKLESQFSTSALDGELPGDISDRFELVHLHIVARHGDRSPNTPYLLGDTVFYECGLKDAAKDNISWTDLKDFPHPVGLHYGDKTVHSAYHSIFPGLSTKRCGYGKLTRTGFQQHKALGQMMRRNYATLLNTPVDDSEMVESIYVQSTDYSRTIRSAAAFMLGFLPDQQAVRKALTIHVSPGDMLSAPPPEKNLHYQPCKHYSRFHDSQMTEYHLTEKAVYHPLLEKLATMFQLSAQNRPVINTMFDSIATRGCHIKDSPLPCHGDNCINYTFANKLFGFMDWSFTHYCTEDTAIVATLPFLQHSLLGFMEDVIEDVPGPKRFVLSLGHDTTITYILLALGIQLDKWMSYASRLNFELWKSKEGGEYYIRVLFNGVPCTQRLSAWKSLENPPHFDLLPFSEWKKFLEVGSYRDIQAYNSVCGIKSLLSHTTL